MSERVLVATEFVGEAARALRFLHERGLHGPTIELVVEGLVLEKLRALFPPGPLPLPAATPTPSALRSRRWRARQKSAAKR